MTDKSIRCLITSYNEAHDKLIAAERALNEAEAKLVAQGGLKDQSYANERYAVDRDAEAAAARRRLGLADLDRAVRKAHQAQQGIVATMAATAARSIGELALKLDLLDALASEDGMTEQVQTLLQGAVRDAKALAGGC
jgi:hypothetical protein